MNGKVDYRKGMDSEFQNMTFFILNFLKDCKFLYAGDFVPICQKYGFDLKNYITFFLHV